MSMFSIYDLIKEAGEDETQADAPAADASNDTADQGADDNAAPDTNDNDGNSEQDDDDFDMDGSLDDNAGGGGDDSDSGDDGGSSDMSSDSGGGASGDEDPVEANTNIFDSLTAEEQQMKIIELKNQYRDLYTSTDDIINRLDDFLVDENNYMVINRVSEIMHKLRSYIADYFIHTFPQKSFIENDIKLNQFMFIVSKISKILDKFVTQIENEEDK